jgi:hypothetical protein
MYFQPPGFAAVGGDTNWVICAIAQVIALTA